MGSFFWVPFFWEQSKGILLGTNWAGRQDISYGLAINTSNI